MSIILFDLLCSQPAENIKFHGGGEYTKTVFREFCLRKKERLADLRVCYNHNLFLDDWILELLKTNSIKQYSYRGVLALDSLFTKGFLRGYNVHVLGGLPNRISKKLHNKERFQLFDYVSSMELEKAYRNCSVFFYPTLNEGFGSPPLEAMQYGKTCLVSAVCSLTEIYGDAVYYCNPYDQQEMENRIVQAVDTRKDKNVISQRVGYIDAMQKKDMQTLIDIISEE